MSTDFLKKHAETLRKFSDATNERARQHPDDFWLQMAAENQSQAAKDVEQELKLAYAEEVGELLDLRFIGPRADGSILLDSFIKIAQPLSRAWGYAAYRLRHGVVKGKTDPEIIDTLNLKLAGMAYGSTRIFITGNAIPDLTGESLLQSTLTQTFRLLNVNNDEFYDAVDAVGSRAAECFGQTMGAIDSAGLTAEFSWNSPKGMLKWHGTQDEMFRIRALLDSINEPERYEEDIKGLVAGITDTGRLEMRTPEGKIQIRFPLELTNIVQELSIAKPATIRVVTSRYYDTVAKKDIFKRQMIEPKLIHKVLLDTRVRQKKHSPSTPQLPSPHDPESSE